MTVIEAMMCCLALMVAVVMMIMVRIFSGGGLND